MASSVSPNPGGLGRHHFSDCLSLLRLIKNEASNLQSTAKDVFSQRSFSRVTAPTFLRDWEFAAIDALSRRFYSTETFIQSPSIS
ncbi:unnamed protein product [Microthlaspi erraticum]|uniref:Uncharacterized protein n=1 Tax=Microthlaspi erraticum TaxID=1685480 RepID=A0A6D2IW33_9BRAS|nr:unnamed protein product [Microthlaspi erraticum]